MKKSTLLTFVFTTFLSGFPAEHSHAKNDVHTTSEKDIKTEIKEFIAHHLQDTHDFHLTKGVSFPLPVILWDNGFQVFSSSKFHHGETVAEHNGNFLQIISRKGLQNRRRRNHHL